MHDSRLTRTALCLSPLIILVCDLLRIYDGSWPTARMVAMQVAFVLFIIGLPSIDSLLDGVGPRVRALPLVSLVIGAMAGAAMIAVDRHHWMLNQAGFTEAAALFTQNPAVFLPTRPPGLFYPIGLLALALLVKPRRAAAWQRIALALGALLFPIGRIGGVEAANLGSALFLALVWWTLLPPTGDLEPSR